MKTAATVVATFAAVLVVLMGGFYAFIFSGIYDITAVDPHFPPVRWVIQTVKRHSISRYSEAVAGPSLDNPAIVRRGAALYTERCTSCHDSPATVRPLAALRMRPSPPPILQAAQGQKARETFWVIKNGIKMTGMPSWGPSLSDAEVWAIVAFIHAVPQLTAEDYFGLLLEDSVLAQVPPEPAGYGVRSIQSDAANPPPAATIDACGARDGEIGKIEEIEIAAGQIVAWRNAGDVDASLFISPQGATLSRALLLPEAASRIRSRSLAPRESFRYRFRQVGRYLYACVASGSGTEGVDGRIIVRQTTATAGSG